MMQAIANAPTNASAKAIFMSSVIGSIPHSDGFRLGLRRATDPHVEMRDLCRDTFRRKTFAADVCSEALAGDLASLIPDVGVKVAAPQRRRPDRIDCAKVSAASFNHAVSGSHVRFLLIVHQRTAEPPGV